MKQILLVLSYNSTLQISLWNVIKESEIEESKTIIERNNLSELQEYITRFKNIDAIAFCSPPDTTTSLNVLLSLTLGLSYGLNCPLIEIDYYELCAFTLKSLPNIPHYALVSYEYTNKHYMISTFSDDSYEHLYIKTIEEIESFRQTSNTHIFTTYVKFINLLSDATFLDVNTSIFAKLSVEKYLTKNYVSLKEVHLKYL